MMIFEEVTVVLSKQCVDSFVKAVRNGTTVLFQKIARECKTTFEMSCYGRATFKGEWVGIVSVYNSLQSNLESFQNNMPLTLDIEMIAETVPSCAEVSDQSTNSEPYNENAVQYDRTFVKTETADYTTTDHSYSKLSLLDASHINGNAGSTNVTYIKMYQDNNLSGMNLGSEQPLREDNVHGNITETENNREIEIHIDRLFKNEQKTLDGIIADSVTSSLDISDTNKSLNNSVFITTFHGNISSVKTEPEILDTITVDPNFAIDLECISMIDADTLTEPENINNNGNTTIDSKASVDTDAIGMVDGGILNEEEHFGLDPLSVKTRLRKRTQKRFDDFDYSDTLTDDVSEDDQITDVDYSESDMLTDDVSEDDQITERRKHVQLCSPKTVIHRERSNSGESGSNEVTTNNEPDLLPKKKRGRPSKKLVDKIANKTKDSQLHRREVNAQDSIPVMAISSNRSLVSSKIRTKIEVNHNRETGKEFVSKKGKRRCKKANVILLKCQHCRYTTYNPELLNSHHEWRHLNAEQKKFQCRYCDKKFGVGRYLNQHVRKVHETSFPCDKCGTIYKTKQAYELHKAKHEVLKNTGNDSTIIKGAKLFPKYSNTTLLKCTLCNYTSYKEVYFMEHQQRVHLDDEQKKFQCQYCLKLFGLRRAFKTHVRKVHELGLFSCSQCPETYKTKHSFDLHKVTHDTDYVAPDRPRCPECKKTFSNVFARNNHLKWIHRGEKRICKTYLCNICGKIFRGIGSYKQHQQGHTGERPFSCIVCGRTFRDASSLKSHCIIHDDVRNYKCKLCAKTFKHKTSLASHQLTHTKVQKFNCPSCNRPFGQASSLARHLLTHIGAKPYQCNSCTSVFTDKSTARRHVILVHKVKSNWQGCVSKR